MTKATRQHHISTLVFCTMTLLSDVLAHPQTTISAPTALPATPPRHDEPITKAQKLYVVAITIFSMFTLLVAFEIIKKCIKQETGATPTRARRQGPAVLWPELPQYEITIATGSTAVNPLALV